jgi:hypothetical protein
LTCALLRDDARDFCKRESQDLRALDELKPFKRFFVVQSVTAFRARRIPQKPLPFVKAQRLNAYATEPGYFANL